MHAGGSHEGYCKWLCAAAFKKGWRACVMNNRGCSGLKLLTKRVYSATCFDDLQLVRNSAANGFRFS